MPHSFEQVGNLRFMNLGFSSDPGEFSTVREEAEYSVYNEAFDLPGRQSPAWTSTARGFGG
jgi:hypothetical protein